MPEIPWKEADVVVNGHTLTFGQSKTLRVALEAFASYLIDEGLGDDAIELSLNYLDRIQDIRKVMYHKEEEKTPPCESCGDFDTVEYSFRKESNWLCWECAR